MEVPLAIKHAGIFDKEFTVTELSLFGRGYGHEGGFQYLHEFLTIGERFIGRYVPRYW